MTVVRPGIPAPSPAAGEQVVPYDDFVAWVRRGSILLHLGRYREGRLLVSRVETAGRPLPIGLALRLLSRGEVAVEAHLASGAEGTAVGAARLGGDTHAGARSALGGGGIEHQHSLDETTI